MKTKTIASHCDETGGKLMPAVNFNNCGAKEDCIAACPYNVFEMQPIAAGDAAALTIKGKIKSFFFKQKAYVVYPQQCHACGICVQACPEKAITLIRVPY